MAMTGVRHRSLALGLVLLMLTTPLVGLMSNEPSRQAHLEERRPMLVGAGDEVNLTLSTVPNSQLTLDLPTDEPVYRAELALAPRVLPAHSGFVWDEASDWEHPDALRNGTLATEGTLTGTAEGQLWDFNNGAQGWTFSNSFSGRITTPTCGFNGSTGGSIRTHGGSTYATSPTVDLTGGQNIPFHAWVLQGSFSCGEEPDSGEDLQFQYKNAAGSWVTFQTYLGSTSGGSAIQFMTTLPNAALHATSQFRLHQTSGSTSCCDFWYIDDVHLATPPESNWTSPSLGHASGVTVPLADDTYMPLHIEATIPTGSWLNWSVLDATGEPIPGMSGSNTHRVPLNLLDHTVHDEVRLLLEFKGGEDGMPRVHAVSGDGAIVETMMTDPALRGWTHQGSSHNGEHVPIPATGGCGVDPALAGIEAYPDHPVFNLTASFDATLLLTCNPQGAANRVAWTITDEAGDDVDSGSFQLLAPNAAGAYSERTLTSTSLDDEQPMNYTLNTVYEVFNTTSGAYDEQAWSNASFATARVTDAATGKVDVDVVGALSGEQPVGDCSVDAAVDGLHVDLGEAFEGRLVSSCPVLNETMEGSWTLVDLNTNNAIDSGTFNWTNIGVNRTYSVNSNVLSTQSAGQYRFTSALRWYNTLSGQWSTLDSDFALVTVSNHTALYNTTACGATVHPYAATMSLGDGYTGTVESTCGAVNATLRADYAIMPSGSSTVIANGSLNWTNSEYHRRSTLTVTDLSSQPAGSYDVEVRLLEYNATTTNWTTSSLFVSYVDIVNETVVDAPPSQCTVRMSPGRAIAELGQGFTGQADTLCSPTRDNLTLTWSLTNTDSNTTVTTGSVAWTSTQAAMLHPLSSSALSTQPEGNYSLSGVLSWYNTSAMASQTLDSASSNFEVRNTSAIGVGDMICSVDVRSTRVHYVQGSTFEGELHTQCPRTNATLWVDWTLENTDASVVIDSGSFAWTNTAFHREQSITSTAISSLSPVNVALKATLSWYNTTPTPVWNWSGVGAPPLDLPRDCGEDLGLATVNGWTTSPSYASSSSLDAVVFGTCFTRSTDVRVTWSMTDEFNTVLHSGSSTWNQTSALGTLSLNGLSMAAATPTVHTLRVAMEVWNDSASQWDVLDTSINTFVVQAEHALVGGAADVALSPWYLAGAALYDLEVTGTTILAQVQARHHPGEAWSNITLPYRPNVSAASVGVQLKFQALPPSDGNMANFTTWTVEDLEVGLFGGQLPARPSLDINLDQRYEWGHADPRIGSWGSQDRFTNGEERLPMTLTNAAPVTATAWVPADGMLSLSFGFHGETATVHDVALFVQNTFVLNRSFDGSSVGTFALSPAELVALNLELASVGAVHAIGTNFTELRMVVTGQGNVELSGLRATYVPGDVIVADADDAFVLALNQARTGVPDTGGLQSVPLPFLAESRGGLTVEVLDLQTSSTLELIAGGLLNPPTVLTPSANEQTVRTQYTFLGASATHHRLDVFSADHHAVFLFPVNGGNTVALQDAHLVTVGDVNISASSTSSEANISFRLRPEWDDEMRLTVTSRIVLSNGVMGVPFTHTWGGLTAQGYENDLELRSLTFANHEGVFPSDRQYIRGGESMNVSVEVGFEDVMSADAFAPGDARLTLYRDGQAVANTTELDGVHWNLSTVIPFTYADVAWSVDLVSLNGSDVVAPASLSRTFTVDSVRPRVLDASMDLYDHRTPSPTQVAQITVMDQPVLPDALDAMVWMEWRDDANGNGWPDEGEFSAMPLLVPSDRTQLTGVYTLMLDDTGGALGDKVSVYIAGRDPSGYAIQDGGSGAWEDQLFTYQLAVDGAPTVAADAFRWSDGRQPWLHPGQIYDLSLAISEPNGGSDLATVEAMLAGNQGSDTMSIEWDFSTKACTTDSLHVTIIDCEMRGADGPAGPFEPDMVLDVTFELGWNTPDLGENRREPSLRVVDRAGQEAFRAFPEHRWRFSAGLSIPDESVSLVLSRGSFLGDGARVTPSTSMEVSGGVVFAETMTVPEFDCDIDVLFGGRTYTATTINGIWSMPVQAPMASGSHPLTWSVGCLEGQGEDLTDRENAVRWILVDGTGPEPVEVLSPRTQAVLGGEWHEVRLVLNEMGGLDLASLELVWEVEDATTGDIIRNGREPLTLVGEEVAGLRLELTGEMNLSEITQSMLVDRLLVNLRVEGRDLAGNTVQAGTVSPDGENVAVWDMEWLQPAFTVSPSSLTYSRLLLDLGESTSIQLELENIGTLEGSVEVLFEEVTVDGQRSLIQRQTATAPAGGVTVVALDWQPEAIGLRWVEATLSTGGVTSGPTVDVRSPVEPSFSEKVFGDVNPVLGTITGLLFVAILGALLVLMRRMTVNQGSKEAYDWDEYSADIDDDEAESHDEDDDAPVSEPPSGTVTTAQSAAPASKTANNGGVSQPTSASGGEPQDDVASDWVKGSDGYWWYHDKASGDWWYKDANGDIVKHP